MLFYRLALAKQKPQFNEKERKRLYSEKTLWRNENAADQPHKKKCTIIQELLEAKGLAAGKDHQFKGRYDAEKNAVIISLETDEQEK